MHKDTTNSKTHVALVEKQIDMILTQGIRDRQQNFTQQ